MTSTKTTALLAFCLFMQCADGARAARTKAKIEDLEVDSAEVVAPLTDADCPSTGSKQNQCDKQAKRKGCVEYYRCEGADGTSKGTDHPKLGECAGGCKGACRKRCAAPKSTEASTEPVQQVTSPQAEVYAEPEVIAQPEPKVIEPEVIDQPEPEVAKPKLTDADCPSTGSKKNQCDKQAKKKGCVEYYRCEGADGSSKGMDHPKLGECAGGCKGACRKRCAAP